MPTATIEVAYVNQPKPGKKKGSVKAANGEIYGVWPSDLGRFQVGQQITFNYEESTFNGQTYKSAKFPKGAPPAPTPMAASSGPAKSEEMFVMGVIGRTLQGTGSFPDPVELTNWVKAARMAWRDGFSNKTAEKFSDLNDEIPF